MWWLITSFLLINHFLTHLSLDWNADKPTENNIKNIFYENVRILTRYLLNIIQLLYTDDK